MRTTPARLATALRLAKHVLEAELRHWWAQEDEDWYISVLLDPRGTKEITPRRTTHEALKIPTNAPDGLAVSYITLV